MSSQIFEAYPNLTSLLSECVLDLGFLMGLLAIFTWPPPGCRRGCVKDMAWPHLVCCVHWGHFGLDILKVREGGPSQLHLVHGHWRRESQGEKKFTSLGHVRRGWWGRVGKGEGAFWYRPTAWDPPEGCARCLLDLVMSTYLPSWLSCLGILFTGEAERAVLGGPEVGAGQIFMTWPPLSNLIY